MVFDKSNAAQMGRKGGKARPKKLTLERIESTLPPILFPVQASVTPNVEAKRHEGRTTGFSGV